MFFILPSFVLSGVMLPYELMPPPVREIGGVPAALVPDRTARDLHARRRAWRRCSLPFVALFAIFAVLLAAIRWRMKPRLA